MTSSPLRRGLLIVTAALSIAGVACSSGGGGEAAPPQRAEPGQLAGEPGAASSPGTGGGLAERLGPALEAAEVLLAVAVDDCLVGQGLPPLDHDVPLGGPATAFGITTGFGLLPDGTPATGDDTDDGAAPPFDEAQAAAHMTALFGAPEADDDPGAGWGGGCFGQAAQQVYGDAEGYHELEAALDALDEAVARDPRRLAALAGWRTCMQEQAGVAPDDPETLVADLAEAAAGEFFATPEAVEYPAPDDTVEGVPAGELQPGVDEAAVAARQAEEERLAAAAAACAAAELDGVEAEVRSDLEARFVDDHRDLLDRLDQARLTR